ncbi:hypothetical protein AVEN_263601-1 [Araneus ventricosus]|uniref:Uncharacterized protein n=1 Tax=Araneus ventricosus TaxID=182803 RepID=A0A4Y2AXK1_ARAVE|nr:hypothetical protein AVEN_263601-1 [Araneus ventricosus]
MFLVDRNNRPFVKINFKIPARNTKFNHWVLTVEPEIFSTLMAKEGLYFQFSRLRFTDFINVKLCKQCFGYGHNIKYREDREKVHRDVTSVGNLNPKLWKAIVDDLNVISVR